jgi:hypothetical protein
MRSIAKKYNTQYKKRVLERDAYFPRSRRKELWSATRETSLASVIGLEQLDCQTAQ